jgi:hypothetical protein
MARRVQHRPGHEAKNSVTNQEIINVLLSLSRPEPTRPRPETIRLGDVLPPVNLARRWWPQYFKDRR